jgi:serine/threonine protein kinase
MREHASNMNNLDRGGINLREILDESAPLPIAQSVAIGAQVAYELAHAHDRGFVHRGVRPANIVVYRGPRYADGIGTARLCATRVSSDERADAPDYQSPEQIRGDAAIDGRADVFALGVVLYEMLTGRLPDNASEPQLPSELNPDVPCEIDGLVLAMLAKERDDRLPTAIVAGHALHRIDRELRGQIAPEPAALAVKPARVAVDRLLRTPVSITVAAVVVGFIGGLVYFAGNTVPDSPQATAKTTLAAVTPQVAATPQPSPTERPVLEELPVEPLMQRAPPEAPASQAPHPPTLLAEKPLPATSALRSASPARVKHPSARSKSRASARPSKPETGKIIISVSPWAEIYVNGMRRGTSPPVSVIELSPGKHRIDIRHSSQSSYLAYVKVKAVETRKLRHDFAL